MVGALDVKSRDEDKRILIVAAHPDDEVLGLGGTIAKISGEHQVYVAILGEGVTSRFPHRSEANSALVEELQTDARAVAKLLGVTTIVFEGLPDNRFDQLPLLEIVKRVERLIEDLRPVTIYTHHPGDLNIDHVITFRATLTATRPVQGCPVKDVYTFEVPSSTEWGFECLAPGFRPSVFVDISGTIETKIRAIQTYSSEMRPFPHPRSPEALRAIARRWGSVAGVDYAEAFELIRSVR